MLFSNHRNPQRPAPGGDEPLRLITPQFPPESERLLHLVIGSPDGVRSVIHLLHSLRYAEQGNWTKLLVIPDTGLNIAPKPGEVFSLLQRDRPIPDQ
jgi:hypothetical protein